MTPPSNDPSASRRPTSAARRPGLRRVPGGIKLRRDRESLEASWLARAWLDLLRRRLPDEAMEEGLEYARKGQLLAVEISPGRIDAQVHGVSPQPIDVRLTLPVLDPGQWDRLIDAMAAEAMYVAALLAGDLPESVRPLFERVGAEPLPAEPSRLEIEAGRDAALAARCAAAVGFLVAEQLAEVPSRLLTLRGIPASRVLEALRQRRAIEFHGIAVAHADPLIPESQTPAPALELCIEEYWRAGHRLAEVEQMPPSHHVPHALLRRLGPSTLNGRFPLSGLLASAYDAVSTSARALRERPDQPEPG